MQKKQQYIQLLSDSIIPLLGFFYWEWSIYFIVLFYFIDLLIGEIIMHLKSSSIQQKSSQKVDLKKWLLYGSMSFLLMVSVISLTHIGIRFHEKDIQFTKEIWSFWTYKELGIQQGYILIPLIGFAAYMRYKMEFLVPKKYLLVNHTSIWKPHLKTIVLLLTGVVLGSSLLYFVDIPDEVILLTIVVLTSAVKYFFPSDLVLAKKE